MIDVLFEGPEVDEARYAKWREVVNNTIDIIAWDFVEVETAPKEIGGVKVVRLPIRELSA